MAVTYETVVSSAVDPEVMRAFIYQHGDNGYNLLEIEDISGLTEGLATGQTLGVQAVDARGLAGVAICFESDAYARYLPETQRSDRQGIIDEIVVRQDLVGNGVGTRLFGLAIDALRGEGIQVVLSTHHADNVASAAMMAKNGLTELTRFRDERRSIGSRITVVRELLLPINPTSDSKAKM